MALSPLSRTRGYPSVTTTVLLVGSFDNPRAAPVTRRRSAGMSLTTSAWGAQPFGHLQGGAPPARIDTGTTSLSRAEGSAFSMSRRADMTGGGPHAVRPDQELR